MQDPTTDFVNRWISRHIQDSSSLGKPMILEECAAAAAVTMGMGMPGWRGWNVPVLGTMCHATDSVLDP